MTWIIHTMPGYQLRTAEYSLTSYIFQCYMEHQISVPTWPLSVASSTPAHHIPLTYTLILSFHHRPGRRTCSFLQLSPSKSRTHLHALSTLSSLNEPPSRIRSVYSAWQTDCSTQGAAKCNICLKCTVLQYCYKFRSTVDHGQGNNVK